MEELEATFQLMEDMKSLLCEDEEVAKVNVIKGLWSEIENTFIKEQTDARELIQNLLNEMRSVEAILKDPETQQKRENKLQSLNKEKQVVLECIESFTKDCANLEEETKALAEELEALEKTRVELESTKLVEMPRTKHLIALYMNITKIKWQYGDDSRCKGYFAKKTGSKAFDLPLSPDTSSRVEMADQLWAMMA